MKSFFIRSIFKIWINLLFWKSIANAISVFDCTFDNKKCPNGDFTFNPSSYVSILENQFISGHSLYRITDVTSITTPTNNGDICDLPFTEGNYEYNHCYIKLGKFVCPTKSGIGECTLGNYISAKTLTSGAEIDIKGTSSQITLPETGSYELTFYVLMFTNITDMTLGGDYIQVSVNSAVNSSLSFKSEKYDYTNIGKTNVWQKKSFNFNAPEENIILLVDFVRLNRTGKIGYFGFDQIEILSSSATTSATTATSTTTTIATSQTTSTTTSSTSKTTSFTSTTTSSTSTTTSSTSTTTSSTSTTTSSTSTTTSSIFSSTTLSSTPASTTTITTSQTTSSTFSSTASESTPLSSLATTSSTTLSSTTATSITITISQTTTTTSSSSSRTTKIFSSSTKSTTSSTRFSSSSTTTKQSFSSSSTRFSSTTTAYSSPSSSKTISSSTSSKSTRTTTSNASKNSTATRNTSVTAPTVASSFFTTTKSSSSPESTLTILTATTKMRTTSTELLTSISNSEPLKISSTLKTDSSGPSNSLTSILTTLPENLDNSSADKTWLYYLLGFGTPTLIGFAIGIFFYKSCLKPKGRVRNSDSISLHDY